MFLNFDWRSIIKSNLSIEFSIRQALFRKNRISLKAVDGVSIEIKTGESFGLVGESGSGKSTLLGLLAGVYYPNQGEVIANTSSLGFVGPNPLIFDASLKENLMYGNKKKLDWHLPLSSALIGPLLLQPEIL